jgi:hypothetical protein
MNVRRMMAAPRFAEYSHMEPTFLRARAELRCKSPRMSLNGGTNRTSRAGLTMFVVRGGPEVNGRR